MTGHFSACQKRPLRPLQQGPERQRREGAQPPVAKRCGCSDDSRAITALTRVAQSWQSMAALRARGQTAVQLASRTRGRTRSRTLLTIERTCPAGASWSLPLGRVSGVERFAYDRTDRGFQTLRRLQIPSLSGHWCNTWGQLPPAQRARGGIYGCRGCAASDLRAAKCAK